MGRFERPQLVAGFSAIRSMTDPLQRLKLGVLPISHRSCIVNGFSLCRTFPSALKVGPAPVSLPSCRALQIRGLADRSGTVGTLLMDRALRRFLGRRRRSLIRAFGKHVKANSFSFSIGLLPRGTTNSGTTMQGAVGMDGTRLRVSNKFRSRDSVYVVRTGGVERSSFGVQRLCFPCHGCFTVIGGPVELIFSRCAGLACCLCRCRFARPGLLSSVELVGGRTCAFRSYRVSVSSLVSA